MSILVVTDSQPQRLHLHSALREGGFQDVRQAVSATEAFRVLGLDAPRGKGNDANRERVNLIADGEGGSSMNWKDRRTGVVARMYLDTSNQVWLQFSDYTQNPPAQRRLGLSGDERPR